jgi:hypothetical protein
MVDQADVDVELIIGQCWVAFGGGAGHIRVSRSVIAYGRNMFLGIIAERQGSWEQESASVLEVAALVGRLSAQLAVADGFWMIREQDLQEALRRVRAGMMSLYGGTPYCGRLEL